MLDTIYCCRFGQRGRRAVLVVLSAGRHRGFCSSAARPQTAETSRSRRFFGMTGIGGANRPSPERELELPRLSERLSPAPPQVRCLSCRRLGAACSFTRSFHPVTTTVLTRHGNRHLTRRPEPNGGGLR